MSRLMLADAASRLGPLCDEMVFVGAAAVAYWLEDRGRLAPRVTRDVDAVIAATTKAQYDRFGDQLRERGFEVDSTSPVIVRWVARDGMILDVMPKTDRVFGFGGGWQAVALEDPARVALPDGDQIAIAKPKHLVAMKLDAYANRGRGDLLASADIEDAFLMLAALDDLIDEIAVASPQLTRFVADALASIRIHPRYEYAVEGLFVGYEQADVWAADLLERRIPALIALAQPPGG